MGRLLIILAFTLHKNPQSWGILVLMPSLMAGWVWLRGAVYLNACDTNGHLQLQLSKFVHRTCESYVVVAEYMQRPQMNELFAQCLRAATKQGRIPMQQIELNNKYFPKWLGPIFVGVYIVRNAQQVIAKTLSVGTFLATVAILRGIADDFGDIYRVMMDYNVIYGSVVALVKLLNMQTDVRTGKAVNRARRQMSKEERLKASISDGGVVEDAIPIKIVDMSFHHKPAKPLFRDVNLIIPQGASVAVVSSGQAGRATLLRLLGQRLQPLPGGQVFVPTHLRVLHVSTQPVMIAAPLWDNLVFGAKDTPPERVLPILDDMGMELTKDLLMSAGSRKPEAPGMDKAEEEDLGSFQKSFPYSELAKIHLARAFIMSAEVTVLQRPFSHFSSIDEGNKAMLVKLMKQLVRNRGVGLPAESVHRRRPRTLIFTPEESQHAEFADKVWELSECKIKVRDGKEAGGFSRQIT
mmetsp:Transcript_24927/g.62475  ORF Transcript_24927/g.62475 Transcript_24927/m.62475 type:complete len:465 (-) Transcript_24927:55-1449(-)